MRTTLNIADDVLFAAKERARHQRRPLGDVVSDLARAGLQGSQPEQPARGPRDAEGTEPTSFYGFEPFGKRGPVVSNEEIDRLREEESG